MSALHGFSATFAGAKCNHIHQEQVAMVVFAGLLVDGHALHDSIYHLLWHRQEVGMLWRGHRHHYRLLSGIPANTRA
jgi:hypothetical protein